MELAVVVRHEVERRVLGRRKQHDVPLRDEVGICLGDAEVTLVLRVMDETHGASRTQAPSMPTLVPTRNAPVAQMDRAASF